MTLPEVALVGAILDVITQRLVHAACRVDVTGVKHLHVTSQSVDQFNMLTTIADTVHLQTTHNVILWDFPQK